MHKASQVLIKWAQVRSGWFEGAMALGVEFDAKKMKMHKEASLMLSTWFWFDGGLPCILQNPKDIHWGESGLHNESGPAAYYSPYFALWSINGVAVDRQIVVSPETQTIKQIEEEKNEDVRSIRINRFGWHRYIEESNSTLIDDRRNDVEGTREALYRTRYGKRLIATCPSGNNRIVALGVPDSIETCQQAQAWLAGEQSFNAIGRT